MENPFENFKRFRKEITRYSMNQSIEQRKPIEKFLSETHLPIKQFPSDEKIKQIHKRIIYKKYFFLSLFFSTTNKKNLYLRILKLVKKKWMLEEKILLAWVVFYYMMMHEMTDSNEMVVYSSFVKK